VNLRSAELREAVYPHRVDSFTILKQANDIVDGNPVASTMGLPLRTPAERTM
jgi:hypothetical protein